MLFCSDIGLILTQYGNQDDIFVIHETFKVASELKWVCQYETFIT